MTLILSLHSPYWIGVAGDRILSLQNGQTVVSDATKLVVYRNEMVFGYTGIAELIDDNGKPKPTDLWITDVLTDAGDRPLQEVPEFLKNSITTAFRRFEARGMGPFRLAILGAGWVGRNQMPAIQPVGCTVLISNFHRESNVMDAFGTKLKEVDAEYEFEVFQQHFEYPDGCFASFGGVGFPPNEEEVDWTHDRIMGAFREQRPAVEILDLMKEAIRKVSTRLHGKIVGRDVLAAIIPLKAAMSDRVVVIGVQGKFTIRFDNDPELPPHGQPVPIEESIVCFRYPDGRDRGDYETPHVVAPGYEWFRATGPADGKSRTQGCFRFDEKSKVVSITGFKFTDVLRVDEKRARRNTRKRRRKK